MKSGIVRDVNPRLIDVNTIEGCATRAIQRTLKMHKALGVPIVVERDGQMLTIPAEEIVIDGGIDKPIDLKIEPWLY